MHVMHQMRLNRCVRWCHYIAPVNDSHCIEVNRIYVDDVNGHTTSLYPSYHITFVSLVSLVSLVSIKRKASFNVIRAQAGVEVGNHEQNQNAHPSRMSVFLHPAILIIM